MYTTSTAYKTEIQKRVRSFECRVTIGDRIFNNEQVQSIELNGGIQDVFSIGNTPYMCLDLVLRNTTDTIFTANPVKVEIGLKIGVTIEYVPLGIFNIHDIKKDDFTTKFTCYDNMSKFDIAYFSSLGDTHTLQQVVNELASKTGVQFTGNLPPYTVKKLEGFTCREILSYIASICGGNAVITRDGKFTIVYPADVNRDIGEGVFDLQRDEVKYKIGKITCQNKENETISKGSLGTDSMELTFENPWVTDGVLQDIFNRLNGFEYLGYTMKCQGDLALDVGDIITYTDIKGVTRKLPIFNRKLSYDGGLDSELSAKGETKNSNSFNSSGSIANKVERTVTELALINKAFIDYANINDADITNLKAGTAKIQILEAETANINNLLAGNIGAGSTQTIHLTAKNVVMDDAVIKNLIASKISVGDLLAGNIDANRFNIVGSNGNLTIKDNTIQIKDSNGVRVQIGKDASNDYNMYVWDPNGKLMFDATGLKADGIKTPIIRDDMVSNTANINASKINITSLITEVNKDNTQTLKASKIAFDSTGQSLEVSFNSLKSNVDNIEIGGRNLVKGSSPEYKNVSLGQFTGALLVKKHCSEYGLKVGDTFTFSVYLKSNSNRRIRARIDLYSASTGETGKTTFYSPTIIQAGGEGRSTVTVTIQEGKEYITGYISNMDTNDTTTTIEQYKCLMLERGNKASDWTPAPEDVDNVTQGLQTQITANLGKIETLVQDTKITSSGSTVKLQDFYSNFIQTKDSITQRVSAVETMQIGGTNLIPNTKDEWSSNTLSNGAYYGKYNDKGFNYLLKNLVGKTVTFSFDIKVSINGSARIYMLNGNPQYTFPVRNFDNLTTEYQRISYTTQITKTANSGESYLEFWGIDNNRKVYIKNLKLEEGDKATSWSPAPEDVDGAISGLDTRLKTAELAITKDAIISTVQATINTAKTDAISSANSNTTNLLKSYSTTTQMSTAITQSANGVKTEVSNTYATINALGNTTSRVQATEQKLTAEGITTTIRDAINSGGNNKIDTVSFTMAKDGFTVKNGAIKILNSAGDTVLQANTNGQLDIVGGLTTKDIVTNKKAIDIYGQSIDFYDWASSTSRTTSIGEIYSGRTSGQTLMPVLVMTHKEQASMSLCYYDKTLKNMYSYIDFDIEYVDPDHTCPIVFRKNIELDDRYIYFGGDGSILRGFKNVMYPTISTLNSTDYNGCFAVSKTEGDLVFRVSPYSSSNNSIGLNKNTKVTGDLIVTGTLSVSTKATFEQTESYGNRLSLAYEMTQDIRGDIGSGIIGDDGECIVYLDDIFLEVVNTKVEYQVFLQKYNKGTIEEIIRDETYFIVIGTPGIKFGWEIKAYRKGRELDRNLIQDYQDELNVACFENELNNTDSTLEDLLLS